jgi:hypothetical protein
MIIQDARKEIRHYTAEPWSVLYFYSIRFLQVTSTSKEIYMAKPDDFPAFYATGEVVVTT